MPAGTFLCMCYAKDRLIVLGSNVGTYSRDGGDTWVSVVVPEGTYWTIAWHETLQILIGFNTNGPNIVSTDLGETWKQLLHIPGTTGYGSSIWIPELKKAITIVNAKQYSMLDYIPGIGG